MSDEKKLVLDVGNDGAARSIMFAYLHARGIDTTYLDLGRVCTLAQTLADNPEKNLGTVCQTWSQFARWPSAIANKIEGMDVMDCTLSDVLMCLGATGYQVAAVIIRGIDDTQKKLYSADVREQMQAVQENTDAQ